MTFAIDHIGLLVTNDPTVGDGPLGIVRDVALVIDEGMVVAIEPAGVSADDGVDTGGRCVIPGFVDSHTHLVFAGDRSDEFVARMAGAPYQAGGINTTVAATRAASQAELTVALQARLVEAHRNGITSLEIKSGYGLTVADEARLLQVAATVTQETTLLGAHVVPPEYAGRADDYVELVRTAMLDAAPRRPAGSTRSARSVRSTPTSAAPSSPRLPSGGSARASTPTSSGSGRACSSRSGSGARRPTTAPTSPTPTSRHSPVRRPWPPSCPLPTSRPASRTRTHVV